MERIGLHNYEAFFLDYLEGNLNAQEEFELLDFLEKNPDLKEELDFDIEDVVLVPPVESSDQKNALKKIGIQPEEVEELMIASVEGQLSEDEEMELVLYIQSNNLGKTFAYYKNTVLVASSSEGYGDKSDLKKKSGIIVPMFYRIAAAAAAILILISISLQNNEADPIDSGLNETSSAGFAMSPKNNLPRILPSADENEVQPTLNHIEPVLGNQFVAVGFENELDTTKLDDGNPIIPLDDNDQIVQNDSLNKNNSEDDFIPDDIAINDVSNDEPQDEIITEEPIKAITNLAGGLFNKDISYSRDKKKSSNDYVAHHFKLGRFEFERKKNRASK